MMFLKHPAYKFFFHLLFWLAVCGVWLYLRYQDYDELVQAVAVTIIKVADLAVVIYTVNGWLVPRPSERFVPSKNTVPG